MTLSDLGSIGELIGAIAVLVTLAYLAIQIRQSSGATRAQIRQSIAESQINYVNSRATDPFLRSVTQKMYAGQELDAEEAFGLRVHLVAHIRLFENYHAQHALGTLDLDDRRAMRNVIERSFKLPHYEEAFSSVATTWNRHFKDEIERVLEEVNAVPGNKAMNSDFE